MPQPAGLFVDIEDSTRMIILRWDALQLANESMKKQRADELSESVKILGSKLEYDRSCGFQIDWDEIHQKANSIWTAWMRAMMNGSGFGDAEYAELSEAIENARATLTPSLT